MQPTNLFSFGFGLVMLAVPAAYYSQETAPLSRITERQHNRLVAVDGFGG